MTVVAVDMHSLIRVVLFAALIFLVLSRLR